MVAASIAAYAVRQLNVKNSKSAASADKLTGIHIFELQLFTFNLFFDNVIIVLVSAIYFFISLMQNKLIEFFLQLLSPLY